MTEFKDYAERFETIRFEREDGILVMRLHSDGGPLRWSLTAHHELEEAFLAISLDRGNEVIILTGTGDEFSGPAVVQGAGGVTSGEVTPEDFYWMSLEGKRYVMNMMNIEVPMISAVNGPALRHSQLPVLCDIVLASETAAFQDSAHYPNGLVPGDGHGVIFPFLMGLNRGRYYLMTGQRLSAQEAKEAGLVNEILAPEALLSRAQELAGFILQQPPLVRRYTRVLLTQRLRGLLHEALGPGFVMEGHAWR